jgi:hypothetical protein
VQKEDRLAVLLREGIREITPHRESSPESVTEEVSDVELFESGVIPPRAVLAAQITSDPAAQNNGGYFGCPETPNGDMTSWMACRI